MKIRVNGKNTEVMKGISVSDLLREKGEKNLERVTVQLNLRVLDRSLYDTTTLSDGDEVEFLYFMGGGAPATGTVRVAASKGGTV